MADRRNLLAWINLAILIILLGAVLYLISAEWDSNTADVSAAARKLAGELADNNLPKAAIEEYKRMLAGEDLDGVTRGNLYYMIGKLYYEDLFDYENGAAYFIRARSINPEASYYTEAGKKLIECLEKMGRIMDAKRELDKAVNIDSVTAAHAGEKMVAKIGDIPVFSGQIDKEIQKLPAEMQKEYTSKSKKLEMLNQYIQMELIYKDGLRQGLDRDGEVRQTAEEVIRQAVIGKYIRQNILPPDQVDSLDVYNYYLANKNDKYGGKDYGDVQNEVLQDYGREKFQKAFSDYINKLAAVEKVQVFEENVR
jgi:tetratricopeptide (TPR) repeat protein